MSSADDASFITIVLLKTETQTGSLGNTKFEEKHEHNYNMHSFFFLAC